MNDMFRFPMEIRFALQVCSHATTLHAMPTKRVFQVRWWSTRTRLFERLFDTFNRCQDDGLGPSLPIHHPRHHYPGHVVYGLQEGHQSHSHLPGGLEEACTCKINQIITNW